MRTYDFTLVLESPGEADAAFVEAYADPLFEAFQGDVSPVVTDGRALADCTMEAQSLDDAMRRAVAGIEALGLRVRHIEVEPHALAA